VGRQARHGLIVTGDYNPLGVDPDFRFVTRPDYKTLGKPDIDVLASNARDAGAEIALLRASLEDAQRLILILTAERDEARARLTV
jgi:hypothetical protein